MRGNVRENQKNDKRVSKRTTNHNVRRRVDEKLAAALTRWPDGRGLCSGT